MNDVNLKVDLKIGNKRFVREKIIPGECTYIKIDLPRELEYMAVMAVKEAHREHMKSLGVEE